MNENPYRIAGIAALALAILFPIYWMYAINTFSSVSFDKAITADFKVLNGWDALFVAIGALEVFIYIQLSKLCRNHINGGVSSILLLLLAAVVAIFHATVLIDIAIYFNLIVDVDYISYTATLFTLVCLFIYAVLGFIFAITLLIRFSELSNLLRIFSIGMLLVCVFQFTIILGVINTFLFPALMVILALEFLRGTDHVEVV